MLTMSYFPLHPRPSRWPLPRAQHLLIGPNLSTPTRVFSLARAGVGPVTSSLLPFMANSKARRRRMEGSALRLSAAGRVPAQITRLTRLQTGALVISLGVERGTNLTSASITFARTEISLSGRVRVIVGSAHPHNRLGYALRGSPR